MREIDPGQLIYLILLLVAVGGWFLGQGRANLGKMSQQALVWVFIFIGVIAVVGLWGDIRQTVAPRQSVMSEAGRIELPRAQDGHYYVTAQINGVPVNFVVDTGASAVVLTLEDAQRAGIDTDRLAFAGQAGTANGVTKVASVRLDRFDIGGISDPGLRVLVNQGEMRNSLLGMSYLQRYGSVEIRDGTLILTR
ncbi:TIGR02281 family clan AA aspartic protease [Litorivita sp. NS0012-18]|uniref:retropepsin-like aspartic protease family protein n=1 Tax=Litorivita sp. NS0012-18 TaxID=3127655 RepID=UPI0031069D8D